MAAVTVTNQNAGLFNASRDTLLNSGSRPLLSWKPQHNRRALGPLLHFG